MTRDITACSRIAIDEAHEQLLKMVEELYLYWILSTCWADQKLMARIQFETSINCSKTPLIMKKGRQKEAL